MKSTTEILDEIAIKDANEDWLSMLSYYDNMPSLLISRIQQAMITYAQQAIEEDRKIVAENATVRFTDEDWPWDRSKIVVDKSSVLNAPKLELK